MIIYFLTLESIFIMPKGAKNYNVFTYFGFDLCNVLGAKNNTLMHLLTLESIFSDVKNDYVFAISGVNRSKERHCDAFNYFGVNLCNV